MFVRLKINAVIAAMVSLCLGSVVMADSSTPKTSAPIVSPLSLDANAQSPISQRAEALAVDLMLSRAALAADAQERALVTIGQMSADSERKVVRITSEIDMPFFSFGGLSGVE